MKSLKTADMVIIALFSAVIAVFSQIAIPFPASVSMTLQTFVSAWTGFSLGKLKGTISVMVYISVGAVGIPVFTGFQGGFTALLGMTGGFIFGFIPFVFLCGLKSDKTYIRFISAFSGLIICHICGVLWFSVYSGSITAAFFTASAPYFLKDTLSVVAALFISKK